MLWTNYFVTSLSATGDTGLVPAENLRRYIEEHNGSEAYTCAFDLNHEELKINEQGKKTTVKYDGIFRPALDHVWMDFDSHDGGGLAASDARAFVSWLSIPDYVACYSGSKGFHVGVPFQYFGLEPSKDLGARLNRLAQFLKRTYPTLDTTVFNANRKFRALGSLHPKTGRYKIAIDANDFKAISLEEIKILAKTRGSLTIPIPEQRFPLPALVEALRLSSPLEVAKTRAKANMDKEWTAPSGEAAFAKCGFLKFAKESPAQVNEPQWYAALSIVSRFQDGRKQCHGISHGHPGYSVSECNAKIDQAESESAPRTCANISTLWDGCSACPLNGKIASPVNILTDEESKDLKAGRESEVAKQLVLNSEGSLLRQDKSVFRYRDGHWKELTVTQIDSFKKGIMEIYRGKVRSKDIDSTYKTFFRELPPVPEDVNLFDPHPFCANFRNGTLHVRQSAEFTYSLEFLPHRKDDFLNAVIPFDYIPGSKEQNAPFLEMLERVFQGDVDKDEKIRAVRQMFGACLIPAFPRLFFLYGPSGSGKSTLMLIAKKFLSDKNISGVQPSKFKGFLMEPMIGKLANIVTDVDTKHPISDSEIKMIIDRTPIMIERKGITNVHGMLPAIHLFGGNAIPPTLEGSLGAHTRRWTFIGFNNIQTSDTLYNKEFHHWVFDQSPQGILNFALEGLNDLLERRGHYTTPTTGKEKMKEWQEQSDTVALFLEDIAQGEVFSVEDTKRVVLRLDSAASISRAKLYEIYTSWGELSGHAKFSTRSVAAPKVRTEFYNALQYKGFEFKKTHGDRKVQGIALGAGPESEF